MISRRSFLKGVSTLPSLALVSPVSSMSAFTDTENIELVNINLFYPDLHPDLEDTRIGFLTDFHLGGWVRNEHIENALRMITEAKVDMLLLGGDYIWVPDTFGPKAIDTCINDTFAGSTDEEIGENIYKTVGDLLSPLKFPLGFFGVLGNHDRWSTYDSYKRHLPRGGVDVLLNGSRVMSRGGATIHIFGSEDLWTGVPEAPLFTSTNKKEFKILLTHNPDFASYCYHKKNIPFNLSLSGHTHGGQIKLPLIGALYYNVDDSRYAEGLVDYGSTKFYTGRGLGVVELPVRINCRPEVTIMTLKRR